MIRLLFLIHRYLGIALGLVVTLWCLSGFVMMYVQYPDFDAKERLAGLESLKLEACCQLPADFSNIVLDRFRIEMLDSRPVLRLMDGAYQYVIDLLTGEYLSSFYEAETQRSAAIAAKEFGLLGQPKLLDVIEQDQWTVYPAYYSHRPLYHFAMNDSPGTEFYISSTTGEVVQMTTSRTRFWNWIGAVVHWIYPTMLRQHTRAWLQTVIWLTIASIFLTVIGIYIGLRQYKLRRNRRKSPYRGWALWHHYTGLVFGLLTLTWLISGLFSVNPWGALEGRDYFEENRRLRGAVLDFEDVSDFIFSLPGSHISDSTVRLEGSLVDGQLNLIASDSEGIRIRSQRDTLISDPLPEDFFTRAGYLIRPGVPVQESDWITTGDAYYFNHHEVRTFPVYRIKYDDGERIYLDSVSGELVFAVDRERQWLRWIFHALHRGDFSRLIRKRPIWDFLMWPLMLGVTVGVLSGTWMGFRRVIRSMKNPKKFPLNSIPELD
ncbi:MAG: hypothetical protein VX225_05485 [Pseudomonadota bacterium]|nr:hypothetical protein [Pseudomonadota bacterium]